MTRRQVPADPNCPGLAPTAQSWEASFAERFKIGGEGVHRKTMRGDDVNSRTVVMLHRRVVEVCTARLCASQKSPHERW